MYLVFAYDSYSSGGGINDLILQVDTLEEISEKLNIRVNKTFVYYCGLGGSTKLQFKGSAICNPDFVQIYDTNKKKVIFKCKEIEYFYHKNPKHWLFSKANLVEECVVNIDAYIEKQKKIEAIKNGTLVV